MKYAATLVLALAAGASASSQKMCIDLLGEANRRCGSGDVDRCGIACEDATTQLFLHVRECKDVATGAPESFELQAQMIATGSAAQCAAHAIDCVGAVARAAKCAHALGDAKLAIPDARGDDAACDAVRDVCGDDDYSLAQYATCYGALDKVGAWESVATFARSCAEVDEETLAARAEAALEQTCRVAMHAAWDACDADACGASSDACARLSAVAGAMVETCGPLPCGMHETFERHAAALERDVACACDADVMYDETVCPQTSM